MIEIAQNLDKEFRNKVPEEEFQMLLMVLDRL